MGGCGTKQDSSIEIVHVPYGTNTPKPCTGSRNMSYAGLIKAARKANNDLCAIDFNFKTKDQQKPIKGDADLKVYLAKAPPHALQTNIVKQDDFPDKGQQNLRNYVVKILDDKHKVAGCGYLLTATIVLTSSHVHGGAKKCPYVMFYDKTNKREIEVEIKKDGICVFFEDEKCVMFELEKPVTAFKAAEFNKRLTVSGSDKLEMMSATRKFPGVLIRGIKTTETSDKEISYNEAAEARGRLGGLIFRGDDPIGIHAEEDNKKGKGILFNSLIDEWIKMITDKSNGYEHIQVIIGSALLAPKVETKKASSSSSSDADETEQPQPAQRSLASFNFKDYRSHALMFNLAKQTLSIFNPESKTTEVLAVPDEIINGGYSLIGTKYGIVISGKTNLDNNAALMFNGESIAHLPQSLYNHSQHGSVLFEDKLFLIAGFSEKRVESYNFSTDSWTAQPSLKKDRYDFAVVEHGSKIYVAGGIRGLNNSYSNKIEILEDDEWKMADFDIGVKIKRFSLWPRKPGKFVLFGGQFDNGDMNSKVFHLNFDKEKCHEKENLPKISGSYADRFHGTGDSNCFIMKDENILAKYDSEERELTLFNQT